MKKLLAALDLLVVGFLALVWRFMPPEVPLFFSYPEGEEQLVSTALLLLPLILVNVFVFANEFVVYRFFTEEKEAFSKLIFYLNLFLLLFSAYVIVRIIVLVV